MSPYRTYLDGLGKLAREDRADPLAAAIRARLRGGRESVAGLVPPPLDRDEPEAGTVLMHLYRTLEGSDQARRRLRRAVVELISEAFHTGAALDYLDGLGRLVGFFQVRESADLASALRNQLWGYLEGGLSKPLEKLPTLGGAELERARRALDLWVALIPAQADDLPQHHRKRLEALFGSWREELGRETLTATRFHTLTLLFRALLKVAPQSVGREHLLNMAREVDKLQRIEPAYRRRWLGMCWEYGLQLRRCPQWRAELLRGLKRLPREPDPPQVFWISLQRLDGLDEELRQIWQPVDVKGKIVQFPIDGKRASGAAS